MRPEAPPSMQPTHPPLPFPNSKGPCKSYQTGPATKTIAHIATQAIRHLPKSDICQVDALESGELLAPAPVPLPGDSGSEFALAARGSGASQSPLTLRKSVWAVISFSFDPQFEY